MASIDLLRASVMDQLDRTDRLASEFTSVYGRFSDTLDVESYDRGALGYYIASFYTGWENIFKQIASFFENDVGRDSWHSDLLKRMRLTIPGIRPSVISEDLFQLLNNYRQFRHVFRNAYGFELDWTREKPLADGLLSCHMVVKQQVVAFLDRAAKEL